MTGKQLKEWAAGVPDNAMIEMQEKGYSRWEEDFALRATMKMVLDPAKEPNEEPHEEPHDAH